MIAGPPPPQAVWEAEQHRQLNADLELEAKRLEGLYLAEQARRESSEALLAQARQLASDLQQQVDEAQQLPQLREAVAALEADKRHLQQQHEELQVSCKSMGNSLAGRHHSCRSKGTQRMSRWVSQWLKSAAGL